MLINGVTKFEYTTTDGDTITVALCSIKCKYIKCDSSYIAIEDKLVCKISAEWRLGGKRNIVY